MTDEERERELDRRLTITDVRWLSAVWLYRDMHAKPYWSTPAPTIPEVEDD